MAGTFKQAWLMGKGGPWEVQDKPIPEPGPNEVLVKMLASSICNQTDLKTIYAQHPPHDHQVWGMMPHDFRVWDNRLKDDPQADMYPVGPAKYKKEPYPTRMGHEGMGVVVAMGAHKEKEWTLMDKKTPIKVGDRVACIGTMGGFGEYVISPENELMPVPDHVTNEEASLFEPVCLTTNIVRQTVEQNSTVMVIGAGALGLMCIQLAKIYGAKKVITSEPVAFKRELALKVGADYAIDPRTQNVCHEVEKITNGRFCNAVIECVGLPETIRLIPYVAAQNAKVGCIGACTEPCLIDWSYIHFKGMMVTSQMAGWALFGNFDDMMTRGMGMIASGKLDLKSLITHRFKLTVDDINHAFDLIKKDEVIKGAFIFDK